MPKISLIMKICIYQAHNIYIQNKTIHKTLFSTNDIVIVMLTIAPVNNGVHCLCYIADLNECAVNNGGCEGDCENFVGSYECGCDAEKVLNQNKRSCDGENDCSKLIIVLKRYVS